MSEDAFEDEPPFDPQPGVAPAAVRPRDAASLILIRGGREVLMGQRARGHVFMPDKWVFPGGGVDPGDARAKAARELSADTEALLRLGGVRRAPRAFALAAVRETREETGLIVGGAEGPDLSRLALVARAITPPRQARRFDARFFLADAAAVLADDRAAAVLADDRAAAGEELLRTQWLSFEAAEGLDLAAITRFILKEVQARLAGERREPPFLRWARGKSQLTRLTAPSGGDPG